MTSPSTIITGCDLAVPGDHKAVHGDLWSLSDCYIFNAVLTEKGEAAWFPYDDYTISQLQNKKIITLKPNVNYFERRGVIVFLLAHGQYNTGALNYLRSSFTRPG